MFPISVVWVILLLRILKVELTQYHHIVYYHIFVVWLSLKEKHFLIWLEKQPYTLMEKKKYISIIKANWIEALVLCDMVNIF